jgi:hypothetical protein
MPLDSLLSPFRKGEKDSPPFGKCFDILTILSLSKEGGWEGFDSVVSNA